MREEPRRDSERSVAVRAIAGYTFSSIVIERPLVRRLHRRHLCSLRLRLLTNLENIDVMSGAFVTVNIVHFAHTEVVAVDDNAFRGNETTFVFRSNTFPCGTILRMERKRSQRTQASVFPHISLRIPTNKVSDRCEQRLYCRLTHPESAL